MRQRCIVDDYAEKLLKTITGKKYRRENFFQNKTDSTTFLILATDTVRNL